jgi:DNA-binding NarL/FixJ family response regulator
VLWLLIVDDNEMFRNLLRSSLIQHLDTIDIREAESAEKALGAISNSPPFLIFMDIHLPGENGLKLTRKIKNQYPQTTVVVCTNFDSDEYREAAYRFGADYFVSKSEIKIKKLVKMIQTHIDPS